MSKYSSLPGYDTTSPTCYGDNEDTTASLPESDQQWKGKGRILSPENLRTIKYCQSLNTNNPTLAVPKLGVHI